MASTKEYLDYVLESLRDVDGITYKRMMGEFLLYKDGILFGGVYDDRFLIKRTPYSISLGLKEEIPYENAKPMLLIDTDNSKEIKEIIEKLINDLS